MEYSSLFHVSDYTYCQAQNDGYFLIKLKTGNQKFQEINLYYGDPFYGEKDKNDNWVWVKQTKKLEFMGEGEFSSYYQVRVKPLFKRLRYYFELKTTDNEIYYFGEKGIRTSMDVHQDNFFGFTYPYFHQSDSYNPPKWLAKTIWYQIFPERFNNGDKTNDKEGTLEWNSAAPTSKTFFGGDLRGIIDKLQYIKSLGVNGIYLTPIFSSPSTHKYDTVDYFIIDPEFGTKDDLKEMVSKAHKLGIRVILDAVFNHSSYLFAPFQDVLKNQENSKYIDWFAIKRLPISMKKGLSHDFTDLDYETFAFAANMPKLNVENKEVADYLVNVATYWIKECDIDGWRIDVANEQPHRFWRLLRDEVKKVKEDAVLIGESWSNSITWLYGDQFDSVMNYMFTNLILDYVVWEKFDTKLFIKKYVDLYNSYPTAIQENLFNLLDSHDTARIYTMCNGNLDKLFAAFTFLFTYVGSTSIYYGSEIGMEGRGDPDCRRCMIWDEKSWNIIVMDFIRKIIKLRSDYIDVFSVGKLEISHHIKYIQVTRKLNNTIINAYIFNNQKDKLLLSGKILLNERNIIIDITQ